ncbi:hypothetical protein VTN77DRAFT_7102 [Rasamsonia byssochlamydoides]|uniref:uncharacterized protein n=1 Tax=Rasamsonia byssochlamydoides TaxID=89139 RepID=UPI003742E341
MRLTTTLATLLSLSVGFVVAQDGSSPTSVAAAAPAATSSSSSSYSCAAQDILDACLSSTKPQLQNCPANDWKCLCEQSNNVLTCYNNCPGDPDRFGAEQTMTSYCNAAKAEAPSSTTSASTATATSSANAESTSSTAANGNSDSTSTSTSSASKSTSSSDSTSKGAAPRGLAVEAGTLFAAVALGMGVAL